jgi:hypothetical protein
MATMQIFFPQTFGLLIDRSDASLTRALKQNIQRIRFLLDALPSVSRARNWWFKNIVLLGWDAKIWAGHIVTSYILCGDDIWHGAIAENTQTWK